MAKEPDNIGLKLLRDIRGTLDEHSSDLQAIRKELNDLSESVTYSLGLSAHANVRHETVQKRMDDIEKRLKKLEAYMSKFSDTNCAIPTPSSSRRRPGPGTTFRESFRSMTSQSRRVGPGLRRDDVFGGAGDSPLSSRPSAQSVITSHFREAA